MKFYEDNKNEEIKENQKLVENLLEENKEDLKPEIEDEKKENIMETNPKENSKRNKIILIIIISIIVLLVALFASTGFALLNINSIKMMAGVSINEVDVKGLTAEEAENKITETMQEKVNKDIILKADGFEYSIKLSQIELNYNIENAVKEAYNVGRNGNIFTNNYKILKALVSGEKINLDYTYNEELLNQIISDISVKVPEPVVNTDYYIEGDKLIINKGKSGNSINKEILKNIIINKITDNSDEEIKLEIIYVQPDNIDIEKIYEDVYTEPKDAYYTKDPFQVFPHENGINFDLELAKELLKEEKEVYEIQLTITEPQVTTNKIGTEAFPDLLSTFSTKYDASNVPRTTNLKLAMNKLDGIVINAGEEFSYNRALGKRTAEAGYREAGGYAGGRVVQTLAGGICQISSTLYDAAVYANLEITERHNHMFLAGYVGAGKDATVVYGAYDLKFKNTRKYPVMIKTTIGSGVAKIDIYGIKEDIEYEVEISTKILNYIPFSVKYETDNSLAPGKQKVVQNGMNGARSITYKIVKLNGAQISSTVLSTDTYDAMNKIIKRGPEEVKPQTNQEPSQQVNIAPQKEEKTAENTTQNKKEQKENKVNQEESKNKNTTQNINQNSTLNITNQLTN